MPYTRKVRRLFKKWAKSHIEMTQDRYNVTEVNEGYRRILNRAWLGGKIGVIISGMDCDCSSYHREYVIDMPNSVIALKKWDEDRQEHLDGPETVWFVPPYQVDKTNNYSRDLALEAFEDGHAHVVYWNAA